MNHSRQPFYDISLFPALKELCKNWKIIRDEFQQLNVPLMNINRVNKTTDQILKEIFDNINSGKEYGWVLGWGEVGGNYDWIQYGLIINSAPLPFVSPKLKKTIQLLEEIKGIKLCAFVKLKAHSLLNYHTHPEIFHENLLQLHLPIITANVNNYAYLNVDGIFRQHILGKPIIFDGSLNHFALNDSDVDRVILYMEFSRDLQ